MKRTLKKETIRRVGLALASLLDELDAVKSVMSPKDFDLLIESILQAVRRVPATTKHNRSVDEGVHVATELGDVNSTEMPRISILNDTP